jgi:phage shock protein PspC (stress-responsive transcriptional regulator)
MRKSLGTVVLTLFLGVMIGSLFGAIIGGFVEEGSVADKLFVTTVAPGFEEPFELNLVVVKIWFAIKFYFNLMSVIGVFIASQILKWYR